MKIWAKNILEGPDEKLLYLSTSFCIGHKKEAAIHTAKQPSILAEKENAAYDIVCQSHRELPTTASLHLMVVSFLLSLKSKATGDKWKRR